MPRAAVFQPCKPSRRSLTSIYIYKIANKFGTRIYSLSTRPNLASMNGTFNIMISSKILSSVRLPGWALTNRRAPTAPISGGNARRAARLGNHRHVAEGDGAPTARDSRAPPPPRRVSCCGPLEEAPLGARQGSCGEGLFGQQDFYTADERAGRKFPALLG